MTTRRPIPFWLLLLSVTLLTLLSSPGAAFTGYGKNKIQINDLQWQVLHTPHFEIHYDGRSEELAVRAAIIAERAYKEYSDRLGRDLPWRVPFILYSSHADFSQTNISPGLIGEGTGGFSEPLRNRVVLPYNGSHQKFVHVIRHEIVHAFMFHAAFGKRNHIAPAPLFNVPLWFAEGIAEWLSTGWDAEADMFIRDATINDYLFPLDQVGGFMVYKEGQAAMRMLSEMYGPDKLVEFWWKVGSVRSVPRALEAVYGLSMNDLTTMFRKEMRRRYWPLYSDLELVEEIARPLTDHRGDGTFYNDMPAISPLGDKVAYYSDADGLVDLWLMSALDGRPLRKLGRSRRSSRFETFHSYSSGIGFSPDGQEVAVIARSHNYETLHTIAVETGEVSRSIVLGLDVAVSPVWSPDGHSILVVGTVSGHTDLYLVDLTARSSAIRPEWSEAFPNPTVLPGGLELYRLTDTVGDEATPAFSPDGKKIMLIHNAGAEISYHFSENEEGLRKLEWARPVGEEAGHDYRLGGRQSLVVLDLETGSAAVVENFPAGAREPLWIADDKVAVVLQEKGINNLALLTMDQDHRVTDVKKVTNLLGGVSHLAYSHPSDRLVFSSFHAAGYDIYAADDFLASFSQREPTGGSPEPVAFELPPLVGRKKPAEPLLEPQRVGMVEPYSPSFSLDLSQSLSGGSVYYNPGGGVGMANIVSFSDLLGDHSLSFLVNFYGSLANSDLSATYSYLKKRIDYGGGIFHYNNYYNAVFTGVGELLADETRFKERNYGLFGFARYPLDTFRRFDLELQYLNSERTNFEYTGGGYTLLGGEQTIKRLIQPTLTYTHDTALFGLHGPVSGTRWAISASHTLGGSQSSIKRSTGAVDFRKYWQPSRRSSLALHLSLAMSDGDDPRAFVLGGPQTLRGHIFTDYQTQDNLAGTKLALLALEYRVPFVDYLIFGWPQRWGLTGIGGALFLDLGSAWTDQVRMFGHDPRGRWGLEELHGDFGLGIRANLFFLPMKFDWAWPTDFRTIADGVFQFSIGPEF